MKAIMYHYVREHVEALPYFVYLEASNFERQINYLNNNYHILNKQEIYECMEEGRIIENGIILTFDDGLNDHYKYVYPILLKYGLTGIFYVPTLPYYNCRLLDVHRTHYLIGQLGGRALYDELVGIINPEDLIINKLDVFNKNTYKKQVLDEFTREAKKLLNYSIRPERRTLILDQLMSSISIKESDLAQSFYLTDSEMQEMDNNGMIIGSHSHSHTLLSNLSNAEQEEEIYTSMEFLSKVLNKPIDTFCYPYGGNLSYTTETPKILEKQGISFAFSVESREIQTCDIDDKFYIPRFDCNEFPYGQATGV